jgi:twitching motility protein PilT
MQTSRGLGLAIRLLASFAATLDRLNLHPDLRRLAMRPNGLVLVCGPTGSGKSSTLAALLQEINLSESKHIITVESPIEYYLKPRKAFIRQREVGRDSPSFEQALLDALREDPDVLMVGEMREPETMRLTLNAAETGRLVMTTVHSSTCAEGLQRIVSAFPAEIQSAVAAQLADCLAGAVSQRLEFRPDLHIRIPECEVLLPTNPVKAHIRAGEFFRIQSVLETGAESGMWTWARYRQWMSRRKQWAIPGLPAESPDTESDAEATVPQGELAESPPAAPAVPDGPAPKESPGRRIEIEPVEGGLDKLLKDLERDE